MRVVPRPLLLVVALLAASSAQAKGGVALALNLPDENAVHRDYASGIVAEASARWAMLSPQLEPSESAKCKAEQECLVKSAYVRGASHLLLVGVAGLGARDFVVSIQIIRVREGDRLVQEELLAYSDVHTAGVDARAAGRALAATRFASVPGLPPAGGDAVEEPPPPPSSGEELPSAPTWLGYAGLGALGLSAAAAGAATTVGAVGLFTRPPAVDENVVRVVGVTGAAAAALLFVGGAAAMVVDAYLHR